MIWHYAWLFFQSNALEIPVYYAFYRGRVPLGRTALAATSSNLITHPIVFFGFMSSGASILASILAAEAFAIAGEAFLHRRCLGSTRSLSAYLAASAAANLASWQLGPLLSYYTF
ncbi:MAG: hypothetical protein HY078_16310 [Elusimicrobia bacterium]|nr:hypothetical protein [Elusimicrobiota bacterium]